MSVYIYSGPVMAFGSCIESFWEAETTAVSKRKAESNLKYQYKKQTNRVANTKIDLPGEIKIKE